VDQDGLRDKRCKFFFTFLKFSSTETYGCHKFFPFLKSLFQNILEAVLQIQYWSVSGDPYIYPDPVRRRILLILSVTINIGIIRIRIWILDIMFEHPTRV
jgi:hypothetical protein